MRQHPVGGTAAARAHLFTPPRLQLHHPLTQRRRVGRGAGGRSHEHVEPVLDTASRGFRAGCAVVAVGHQPGHVGARLRRQAQTDRRHERRRHRPAPQHHVDQCPSGAAVSVRERVHRLELGVNQGRLHDRRQVVTVEERAQVLQQSGHPIRRWWHERGRAGVEAVSANPVLFGPDLPAQIVPLAVDHQLAVYVENVVHGDRFGCGDRADGCSPEVPRSSTTPPPRPAAGTAQASPGHAGRERARRRLPAHARRRRRRRRTAHPALA